MRITIHVQNGKGAALRPFVHFDPDRIPESMRRAPLTEHARLNWDRARLAGRPASFSVLDGPSIVSVIAAVLRREARLETVPEHGRRVTHYRLAPKAA